MTLCSDPRNRPNMSTVGLATAMPGGRRDQNNSVASLATAAACSMDSGPPFVAEVTLVPHTSPDQLRCVIELTVGSSGCSWEGLGPGHGPWTCMCPMHRVMTRSLDGSLPID